MKERSACSVAIKRIATVWVSSLVVELEHDKSFLPLQVLPSEDWPRQPVGFMMAFHPSTPSSLTQSKRASSGHGSSQNSSLLLEKAKAHIRRSTPDSEALASSDDEQEQHQRLAQAANPQMQRPNRRASWLSETHGSGRRKSSLSGGDGLTPSASYGTSGNPDGGPWNPAVAGTGRASTASNPFGWGSTIWSDSVKGPPARLAEVLPSPNPHDFSMSTDEPLNSPSLRRDSATDASIPFAIPLHPTLKTYRSQSYSVGQLDQEWANSGPRHSQMGHPARTRAGSSYAGLQHRLSRPSMLSEFSPDTSVLEQLREVDDDDEASTASSEAGVRLPSNNPRTIEQLAMENAILRQQAYANSVHVPTGATGLSGHYPAQPSFLNHTGGRQGQVNESVLEEPDDISVAADDGATGPAPGQYADADPPRYQHISHVGSPSPLYIENRALENVKKGHWQSSLGFGGVADVPQSRRHSFADIPLRGNAVSEAGKSAQGEYRGGAYGEGPPRQSHGENSEYTHFLRTFVQVPAGIGHESLQRPVFAASYFSNPLSRPADSYRPSSSSSSIHQGYTGVQQAHTTSSIRPLSQPSDQLYLVTFKAARAEFYYVQEGTGLEVNAGDLVIVEADRGTDLGTVAHRNVDWASAKQLKERYVTEHYNWLMMFSRQGQGGRPSSSNSPATISGANRPSGSSLPSAAHLGLNGSSDATGIEIKPKMIKRLAQPHEIHMLREKEGNEAKAKRMCQQKVSEHHLNMEILDAEFQM